MSGNFVQRGEPAVINKWARARTALLAGVDLVIELPVVYSMSSAEFFAFGAVKILDSIGIVDNICFGSENENVSDLDAIAEVLSEEPIEYKSLLKEYLKKGLSFPSSREKALKLYMDRFSKSKLKSESILKSSNNILAIEYLKALKKLGSSINPLSISRVNNTYNTQELTGNLSSATSIRNHIQSYMQNEKLLPASDKLCELPNVLPVAAVNIIADEFSSGRGPVSSKCFEDIIISTIRKTSPDELSKLPYFNEGLENRIKMAANGTGCIEDLIDKATTKRYPRTRIQRCIFNLLTGMSKEEFNTFNTYNGPQYARVLGFNNKGMKLLKLMKEKSSIPVITKPSDFIQSCNPLMRRMLEIESYSTDLYVLGYKNPKFKHAGQEFTQSIIINH